MVEAVELFPPGTEVAALPGWSCPRLLFSAEGWRCRWRATEAYPAFRRSARGLRMLLRMVGTVRPGTVRRPAGWWPLGELVRRADLPEVSGAAVLPGTRNSIQKATALLWSGDYKLAGVAKCAFLPAARERLRKECAVLGKLPAGLAPRLLAHGPLEGGGEAGLMEAIRGRPFYPADARPPEKALRWLDRLVCGEPVEVGSHPWFRQNAEGGALLARAQEALAGRRWPVVIEHGDFAPWNLLATGDGIAAIDWEHANLAGFPQLDALHYFLQTAALIFRRSPRQAAREAAGYLERCSASPAEAWALVLLAAYNDLKQGHADGLAEAERLQVWRQGVLERAAAALGCRSGVGPWLEPIRAGWPRLGTCAS